MSWLIILAALAQEREPVEIPDIDVQEFRQSLDAESTLWTNDAGMRATRYFTVRTSFGYMRDPFVFQYEDDVVVSVLKDAVQANVAGTVNFWRMRAGIDLPIYLLTTSDVGQGTAGVGDLLLDLKGTILDHHRMGVGLALAARTTLPTSTMQVPLGGRTVGYEVEAILDGVAGPVLVALNVGHRGVGRVDFGESNTWRDRLFTRFGVGIMDKDRGGFSLDVAMSSPYDDFFGALTTPVEGMVGGWARLGEDVVLRAGVGTGLTGAIGSPLARGLLSVAWEPRWRNFPTAQTPYVGGTPGSNADTVASSEPGFLIVRVTDQDDNPVNGWAKVTYINVPPGVEWPDKPVDVEVIGGTAEATLPPGRVQVMVSSDGFANAYLEGVVVSQDSVSFSVPLAARKAVLYEDRIEILEQVFFESGSASIAEESYDLLDQVAVILKNTPQVVRMRIEGHTDSRGDDENNLVLSRKRADAVLDFLVAKGVESIRLESVGYGERSPIDPRENEEAWELNRRVEFIVETWDGSLEP